MVTEKVPGLQTVVQKIMDSISGESPHGDGHHTLR